MNLEWFGSALGRKNTNPSFKTALGMGMEMEINARNLGPIAGFGILSGQRRVPAH
jgi:hypothetical protein